MLRQSEAYGRSRIVREKILRSDAWDLLKDIGAIA
jgi:hypothetical protein